MSVGYEYGNARLAAQRARLPGSARIRRLGQASGCGEVLALLGQDLDWQPIGRSPGGIGGDARAAAEDLVERWRAAREGGMLRYYDPPVRPLVEALVMPLDTERVVEILRLRRAGTPADEIERRLAPGALLGEPLLRRLARTPTDAALFRALGAAGLVPGDAAAALAALTAGAGGFAEREARTAATEAGLRVAVERARAGRVVGRGADAAAVRAILAGEAADQKAVAAELAANGSTPAAILERSLALERWAALEGAAHRDPLGIGPVAAFVAAVELTVVRLRAVLARVAGAWHDEQAAAFFSGAQGG